MRGRLINPILATFKILNKDTTTYNRAYKEPIGDRGETEYQLRCQVEEGSWFRAKFGNTGVQATGEKAIILHYPDLEMNSLLDSSGNSIIHIGARLEKLETLNGDLIIQYDDGLYAIQANDSSFGLAAFGVPTRNLLFLLFSPRAKI